jgi:peptide/nickel transport system permease protein
MLLSLAIIELPHVILVEATLSFLGFGIQPPNTSLGFIISDERDYITIAPWPITFTGLLLALLCVSFAMVGIGVRRVLDPSESS